jgi:hypothetical protein
MADMNTPIHITLDTLLEGVVWLACAAFAGGLVVPLGLQILRFLRSGEWVPFSGLDAMALFSDSAWLRSPDGWLGIHRMMDAIHGGLFLMAVFGVIGWVLVAALAPFFNRKGQAQVSR